MSLTMLVLLAPVLLATALLVRIKLGSPVLFRQQRPGLHGRPFTLLKFRTMLNAVDANGKPLPDEQRLTRFGSILRKTSLDEMPELWNIFKGEMSFVGPRPLLMQYLDRYTPTQARRHEVRPGLSGWAQINGRNTTTWQQRFEHDVWYVDNRSFWLDLKICAITAWKVIACRDTSADSHATMPEFRPEDDSAIPESSDNNSEHYQAECLSS